MIDVKWFAVVFVKCVIELFKDDNRNINALWVADAYSDQ